MQKGSERTYWEVYEHEGVMKIWVGGKLVGEIPSKEFPHMILQIAKCLKNKDSKMK